MGNRELLKHYMAQPTGHIKEAFEKEKAFMKECCDRVIAIARHSYNMYNPQNDFSSFSKTKRHKSSKNPKTKRLLENQSHN